MLRFRVNGLSRSRTAYHRNHFAVGQSRRSSHILSKFDAACFQPQLIELCRLFFRRPISLAPKKKGLKPTGIFPSKTIFSTPVSFWRNSLPMGPLLFAMRSLYNWGTSRLGPPDDPEGKDLIAFATVGSKTIKLSSTTCWARFAARGGCFH